MERLLKITRALADESRLRILAALRDGELCACEVHDLLGLAQSTVSKHLSILVGAGLVRPRREGRWRHFRLSGPEACADVRHALAWILSATEKTERALADRERLRRNTHSDCEKG